MPFRHFEEPTNAPRNQIEAPEVGGHFLDGLLAEQEGSRKEGSVCLCVVEDEDLYFGHFLGSRELVEAVVDIENVVVDVGDGGAEVVALRFLAEVPQDKPVLELAAGEGGEQFFQVGAEEEEAVDGGETGRLEVAVGPLPAVVGRGGGVVGEGVGHFAHLQEAALVEAPGEGGGQEVEEEGVVGVVFDRAVPPQLLHRVAIGLEGLGVDCLQLDSAAVEAVEAGEDVGHLVPARLGVYQLLPQGVLVVAVDLEVGGKPAAQEGVSVLEYYLHCVLGVLPQQLPGNLDELPFELYLAGLQGFVIDAQILDARPLKV